MNLVKWKPFGGLMEWDPFKEMDSLLGDFFSYKPVLSDIRVPAADIKETDKNYILTLEMPGLDKKDISITLDDYMLNISAERKQEEEEKKENFLRNERSYIKFERAYQLPENVADTVKATYKNGLLELTLDKIEAEKKPEPKRIEIK